MKNILVVIDMQNDFVSAALGSPQAEAIVPAVVRLIGDPRFDGVYATLDTHESDYLDTFEGRHLPVAHCIRGTSGWQLEPAVKAALEARHAKLMEKPTFGSVRLAEEIRRLHPQEITLCGLCTDICVLSNALLLRAYLPDVKITVAADACAATTERKQKETLDVLASCQIDAGREEGK
jgi:nicotinamidase/pyrazinamidase